MISRQKSIEILEAQSAQHDLLDKPLSQWRLTLRRFRGRRSGMVGLGIVVFLILMAIFAPVIAPYPPNEVLIGKEDVGQGKNRVSTSLAVTRTNPNTSWERTET